MHIAIDLHALNDQFYTGKHHITYQLHQAILSQPASRKHHWHLFVEKPIDFELDNQTHITWVLSPRRWRFWKLWRLLKNDTFDLFISPTSYIPLLFTKVPTLTWVYDLAAFDPSFRLAPLKAVLIERMLLKLALKRSAYIITMHKETKQALEDTYPDLDWPPIVIVPGFARPFPKSKALPSDLDTEYILYVGTLEPRKNIDHLIRSHALARKRDPHVPVLVLVGKTGWGAATILELIAAHQKDVRYLGYVAEAELHGLYMHSLFVVYPSSYEGFGLPVIEALIHGKACVVSESETLTTLAGPAGMVVTPEDHNAFAGVLVTLACDTALRQKLEQQARLASSSYSLSTISRDYLAVITAATD